MSSFEAGFVFGDGLGGFAAAEGDDFLGLVVVETAIAAHLDVDEDVGAHQLGHHEGVLPDHQGDGAGEDGVIVEFEVVGDEFVEDLGLPRLVQFLLLGQSVHLLPLGLRYGGHAVLRPKHVYVPARSSRPSTPQANELAAPDRADGSVVRDEHAVQLYGVRAIPFDCLRFHLRFLLSFPPDPRESSRAS